MIAYQPSLRDRQLLGLKDLSAAEIESLLKRAAYWEGHEEKRIPVLEHRFIANMFFENSTRTRFSFEMAQKRLGAQVLNFAAAASSVEKGESIYDTVRTLESMGIDAGVIRLKPIGVLDELAKHVRVPLINAGDGNNEHPTQALLDLYTMRKQFGDHRRHQAQPRGAFQSVGAAGAGREREVLRAGQHESGGARSLRALRDDGRSAGSGRGHDAAGAARTPRRRSAEIGGRIPGAVRIDDGTGGQDEIACDYHAPGSG